MPLIIKPHRTHRKGLFCCFPSPGIHSHTPAQKTPGRGHRRAFIIYARKGGGSTPNLYIHTAKRPGRKIPFLNTNPGKKKPVFEILVCNFFGTTHSAKIRTRGLPIFCYRTTDFLLPNYRFSVTYLPIFCYRREKVIYEVYKGPIFGRVRICKNLEDSYKGLCRQP